MLDDLRLKNWHARPVLTNGLDSAENAKDKDRFNNYPHEVKYIFNSRGFRDYEWPEEPLNQIWGLGDSFTVGVGCPFEHTWVYVLSQKLRQRVINVSLNGGSNRWLARRACQILNEAAPQALIIQWTYIHRREDPNENLPDEERRLHSSKSFGPNPVADDVAEFLDCVQEVERCRANVPVVHGFIPGFAKDVPDILTLLPKSVIYLPKLKIIDFARDGHHYDVLTAAKFADDVIIKLGDTAR
jgi:hypothetical protein